MSRQDASELAIRLGHHAEAVCRQYLSSGRRAGRYWQVGDARNSPGRSMFVRLTGPETGKGAAGKWTDASTGEHGDLLDVIREALGLIDFRTWQRKRAGSSRSLIPSRRRRGRRPAARPAPRRRDRRKPRADFSRCRSRSAARLRKSTSTGGRSRRYPASPRCATMVGATINRTSIRPPRSGRRSSRPSPTSTAGRPARTARLSPDGSGKAPVDSPRRAMGDLLGHGVRFGVADEVLAAGEGIETVLSPRQVMPHMPMMAALSAAHLAAILFPPTLRRLYVLRDRDPAGDGARDSLLARAASLGIEAISCRRSLRTSTRICDGAESTPSGRP